ncbi:FdhF/YdeP family oxidoreductase [Pseudoroseicyclus tamaricis]|uniref:FdhF/YdeP family oxidoreductase n=1 Tax=Pseudoroseicyclus tamaricis TaxID=2705421 RepID=A0A6B2JMJ0_9RHOB|nr:FdhF/YdeP family oxidoreductase [Pseudoroseicyclus tamaricis]NDU99876.1 FdhF/YdeP family oxidoreductase [Pseudoroseicyclus tamaricis]
MADDLPRTPAPRHSPVGHDAGTPEYGGPTGGWGSLEGIAKALGEAQPSPDALRTLWRQNKTKGVMCTSCAWAKPAQPHLFEFCENGAKATVWEMTRKRVGPEFFAKHSAEELKTWPDHDLEAAGRLTHPMRFNHATGHWEETTWPEAYAEIGRELTEIGPEASVFYSSGHAGLETSYLYALFARAFGHMNLPQSSNMCHETTSVNLASTIGVPVGTCTLDDFEHCDAIFFFGQNTGSNSPRFLHQLQAAVERGCRIVTFNPVRERGLIEFASPQNAKQMTVGPTTKISEAFYQVRPGGDVAVLAGMMKRIFAAEAERPGEVLDHAFIAEHTEGLEEMQAAVEAAPWEEIERESGLTRAMIEDAAEVYLSARNVIGIYGMGLTQHVNGWLNLGMLVNLLLLRGNIGRRGAGISPVRGHSNVQGQRTVGIGEKPKHMPAEKLEELFGIDVPTEEGMNVVAASQGILDGKVKALISLGGNLVRALPDRERMEGAFPTLRLSVSIATKLNRSHLVPGEVSYLLPCLGRTDEDIQASGPQAVSMEDSLSHIYGSIGHGTPPSEHLRSELAIVAGIAKETLPESPRLRWDEWTADYGLVRDLIAETFPEAFHDFNDRLFTPGGFYRGNAARERKWNTETGKATFTAPTMLSALGENTTGDERMTLITLRSNDQFNTTIYGYSDRLRGLKGDRMVLLLNQDEIERLGLTEGQRVALVCALDDGVIRRVEGLAVTPYDLPPGCVAGYYPELNPLVPLSYHEKNSQTPAYKGTPVRLEV